LYNRLNQVNRLTLIITLKPGPIQVGVVKIK